MSRPPLPKGGDAYCVIDLRHGLGRYSVNQEATRQTSPFCSQCDERSQSLLGKAVAEPRKWVAWRCSRQPCARRRHWDRGGERRGGRPLTASRCQSGGAEDHSKEASVGEVTTIGLDLAKSIFQAHGADAAGEVVFRRKLRRDQMLSFFAGQPHCLVAMEACSGAHHWARELGALGHEVRLIPPSYVKPFVKRPKNDMADVEAISEAALHPTMRFVAPKSAEAQARR